MSEENEHKVIEAGTSSTIEGDIRIERLRAKAWLEGQEKAGVSSASSSSTVEFPKETEKESDVKPTFWEALVRFVKRW